MTAVDTAPPGGYQLSHRQVLIVMSGLMLGMLLAALDQTIVATALPTIVGDLGGLNHLSWVVTAYLLTSTATTPLYGKISDLYGRKIVFQVAIVIFLAGSALSGLSRNMPELIAFRAVQGIGAGGLMTMALTIVGDVVSPRERGRYQGYFGAVFAVASIGGPLLGGFFTDGHSLFGLVTSWRWVFYINLPLGAIALLVTSSVLNLPFRRQQRAIDYPGAAAIMAGVSALLLVTVWGGTEYPWTSPIIIGLLIAGVALVGLFLWWEQRVAEPILPPKLFRVSVFSVSSAVTFLLGLTMFGAIIFLPVYLQLVDGVSATESGLLLLPLMAGVLAASIGSGQAVSRLGRYKVFPVVGAAVMTVGVWLLSHLGAHTSRVDAGLYMAVLGFGLGLIMQILVLATQNAVPWTEMGVATSAISFFRSMGGSFGTSLFGAVMSAGLAHWLPRFVSPAVLRRFPQGNITASPAALHKLPPSVQYGIIQAFVHALHTVFLVGVPFAAASFVLVLFLREVRLRDRSGLARSTDAVPGGAAAQAAAGAADAAGVAVPTALAPPRKPLPARSDS